MLSNEWKHLKSGTDIRGVAIPDVDGPVDLTDDVVERIAAGFLRWLCTKNQKQPEQQTISVGRDSRLSGPRMRDAVVKALVAGGATVLDCGLASTPAMFMTTIDLHCDGAVQLTASHHPFQRNGLKFFLPSGGVESADIDAILALAAGDQPQPAAQPGSSRTVAYMTDYAARLRKLICTGLGETETDQPLRGFHIVVDAGNGAGGFYATDVLQKLGADISGSQFLEPDGRFPNHIPNPENEEAMASVCAATVAAKADLGVIFDTDVDRAGCVDSAGREINRNRLVALAAAIALENCPGGTIVTDSITSTGLAEFIAAHGGIHRRFMRGYRNVINEAIRLNNAGQDAQVAMETSGHGALKENYFLDDGAYLMVKLLIELSRARDRGESLSAMIADLREPKEARESRMALSAEDFGPYGESVIAALTDWAKAQEGVSLAGDNFEGVRVNFSPERGNGWCLLRMSLHEPLMPLNIESDDVGGVDKIANELYPVLKGFDKLDTEKLKG